MNVLIIYPFYNQRALMQNFVSELYDYEVFGDVICIENFNYEHKSLVQWPAYIRKIFDIVSNSKSTVFVKIFRKIGTHYLLHFIFHKYDLIDFHAYYPNYNNLMRKCVRHQIKFDITLWGTELMRATAENKMLLRYGFDHCYRIKMSDSLHDIMIKSYGLDYEEKSRIVYFGNSDLKIIDSLQNTKSIMHELYDEYDDKKILVFGYNGFPAQNHEKMIDALQELTVEEKGTIHVVLPMTYGIKSDYLQRIVVLMNRTGVSFTILDKFLKADYVAAIRKTADIVVNVQQSDAIAGSLQDHLYCGNVCIFGEWLNYSPYTNNGIFYIQTKMEDIAKHIKDVLHNYSVYKELCMDNHDKIKNLFSWEATIQKQVSVYGE